MIVVLVICCNWNHLKCDFVASLTKNRIYPINILVYLNLDNTKLVSEPRAYNQLSVLFSSSSLVPPLLASAVEANTNLSYKLLPVWIWLHWQLRDFYFDAQSSSPSPSLLQRQDNVAFCKRLVLLYEPVHIIVLWWNKICCACCESSRNWGEKKQSMICFSSISNNYELAG